MTWLKLSDDFADDCARAGLSDAAVRTHVEGLLWTMRRETGGYLDDIDVRKAIETETPRQRSLNCSPSATGYARRTAVASCTTWSTSRSRTCSPHVGTRPPSGSAGTVVSESG